MEVKQRAAQCLKQVMIYQKIIVDKDFKKLALKRTSEERFGSYEFVLLKFMILFRELNKGKDENRFNKKIFC